MDALGIANLALRRIGEGKISAFNADNTAARVCLDFFKPALDETVSEHEWTFAKKREALVLDEVSDNLTDYEYMFDLPSDTLRFYRTKEDEQYIIEGGKLYANANSLTGIYTRSIVDDTDEDAPVILSGIGLPAKFYQACSLNLAFHILLPLNGRPELLNPIQGQYRLILREAMGQDAMRSPGKDDDPTPWHEVE